MSRDGAMGPSKLGRPAGCQPSSPFSIGRRREARPQTLRSPFALASDNSAQGLETMSARTATTSPAVGLRDAAGDGAAGGHGVVEGRVGGRPRSAGFRAGAKLRSLLISVDHASAVTACLASHSSSSGPWASQAASCRRCPFSRKGPGSPRPTRRDRHATGVSDRLGTGPACALAGFIPTCPTPTSSGGIAILTLWLRK